ncbi:hypothetical protein BGZ63DRAFT_460017 [Mariannaea sp. PMI_226]|nr:hypothetical protein BGZ63DRAFT_460017 [Mariannaea sp. PMI_226]
MQYSARRALSSRVAQNEPIAMKEGGQFSPPGRAPIPVTLETDISYVLLLSRLPFLVLTQTITKRAYVNRYRLGMDAKKTSDRSGQEGGCNEDSPNYPSQWGIHWKAPTLMLLFYALSVFSAFGHHVLYLVFDGRTPTKQDWVLRAGTALATICKLFLAASVAISFSQTTWNIVRTNLLTVASLDTLFSATRIPWSLFDIELLSKAKVSLLLASVIWLTPLIPVFTPGSLTVVLKTTTVNKTMEINNLNIFNTSSGGTGSLNFISYDLLSDSRRVEPDYTGPSRGGLSIIYQSVFQGDIMKSSSPCGVNCSFSQSFTAPTYKCEDVDEYDPEAPWCYSATQKPNGTCYVDDPASKNLYFAVQKTAILIHLNWPPHMRILHFDVGCGQQSLTSQERSEMQRKLFLGHGRETGPQNARAIHEELLSIFGVSLSLEDTNTAGYGQAWIPPTGLGLVGTRFAESYPWRPPLNSLPVRNFKALLEEVTANITLSMLAVPELSYLYPENTVVELSMTGPVWTYHTVALITTYAVALALGLACLLLGVAAMVANGVCVEGEFMAILATTRNPAIDEAVGEACLGASGRSCDELKKLRLQFGDISSSTGDGRPHAGFGFRDQVRPLTKGVGYR